MDEQKLALVLLPEIYGCNAFMEEIRASYTKRGIAVFCPNLWMRAPFGYEAQEEAYTYFQQHIGFGVYRDIDYLLEELQAAYDRVVVLGFSAGATLAWRCSALGHADGVIACYGSRIRDYPEVEPRCDTLLLFAQQDSFAVDEVLTALRRKKRVRGHIFPARHGFLDPHGPTADARQAKEAWRRIDGFLQEICALGQ